MAAARSRLPGSTACGADKSPAATGAPTCVGKVKPEAQSAWNTVSRGSSLLTGTSCSLPSGNSRLRKADSYLWRSEQIRRGAANLQCPLNSAMGTSITRGKTGKLAGQVLLPQSSRVSFYRDLSSLTVSWLAPPDHSFDGPAGRTHCFGMLRLHPSHRHPVLHLRARI